MKKLLYLVLAVATFGLVVSCGSKSTPATPGEAAKKCVEYMVKGDYDKLIAGLAIDEKLSKEEMEQSKLMLKSMLEKIKPTLEERGGVKSIEILSEELSEDGQSAQVELRISYGNDDEEDGDYDMVLVDGKWLMDL